MIQYKCEKCGDTMESPDSLMGHGETCPCGHITNVPKPSKVGKFFKQEVSNVVVGDPVEFKRQAEPLTIQMLVTDLLNVLPDGRIVAGPPQLVSGPSKTMFWIEMEFPHHGTGYPIITDGNEFFRVKTKTETKEDNYRYYFDCSVTNKYQMVPAGPIGTYQTLPPKTKALFKMEIEKFAEANPSLRAMLEPIQARLAKNMKQHRIESDPPWAFQGRQ